MIELFWLIWLVGALVVFRRFGGFMYHDLAYGNGVDGEALALAIIVGGIGSFVGWPLIVAVYGVHRFFLNFVSDNDAIVHLVFPEPKPIESRTEKAERKQREAEAETHRLQERISQMEREAGIGV